MMYYRKALELQAFLDMAKDEGDYSFSLELVDENSSITLPFYVIYQSMKLVDWNNLLLKSVEVGFYGWNLWM